MKSLLVLRHSKTEKIHASGIDRLRELTDRGIRDAGIVGKALKRWAIEPDIILCSPAQRAIQTRDLVLQELDSTPKVEEHDTIYSGDVQDLVQLVSKVTKANIVMIIGHNPLLEELMSHVIGNSAKLTLKTSGLASVQFDFSDWSEILFQPGSLAFMVYPELIK